MLISAQKTPRQIFQPNQLINNNLKFNGMVYPDTNTVKKSIYWYFGTKW